MKRLLKMLLFVGCLLVVSCSVKDNDNTVSGFVVGKQHIKAHRTRHYNATLHTHTTTYYPEQWVLWVADSTRVQNVRVDKNIFDSSVKGQHIRLGYGEKSK